MKNRLAILSLSLSALVAAPTLVSAQSQMAPVRLAKVAQEPMPKAQELLDNLFAPYMAAKTFSGSFDVSIEGDTTKIGLTEMNFQNALSFQRQGRFAEAKM